MYDKHECVAKSDGKLFSTLSDLLLDSSLIVTTNNLELYDYKVISCNDYVQIYKFSKSKSKQQKDLEKDIKKIDTDFLFKNNQTKEIEKENKIEIKNIMRSKLECQRLAKCNASEWKTFITLTFTENIKDIKYANKRFRYYIDKIQRVYKNFKYICIPEFQKRGAVHYHLLTNIDINDKNLIYEQEDNHYFKHIKYWNDGFTKVDILEKDIKKIIGYISKYMTKDIDDRLFNCHRYFYSRNLKRPIVNYINLNNEKHLNYLKNTLENKKLIYKNQYISSYDNESILFEEFLNINS